jgi:TRAP-type mannitol/chloroaromatic compound transport system permease large subunit
VFRGLGGERIVTDVLTQLPGGADGAVLVIMLLMFVLGFFLDTFEIIFIVVPITAPVLLGLGVDPLWLGVMMGINLQTSFLTPPFGFSLFYLRGVAPPSITTMHIYRGALPLVALQLLALVTVWHFPQIATWLPAQIYGTVSAASDIEPATLEMPDDLTMPADGGFTDGEAPAGEGGNVGSTLEQMIEEDDLIPPPE